MRGRRQRLVNHLGIQACSFGQVLSHISDHQIPLLIFVPLLLSSLAIFTPRFVDLWAQMLIETPSRVSVCRYQPVPEALGLGGEHLKQTVLVLSQLHHVYTDYF